MKNINAYREELHLKQTLLTFLKNKKDTILPVVVVFCLPVLLYLQTIRFGFVDFDDHEIISKHISFLTDFRNAPQAFLTDAFLGENSHFYRPLQTLSYMADIQLSGGNNFWMYHLTNVLLWGLIACSLFLLLKKFLVPSKLALLITLVYSAHPLFISSVAWIPARGDLLLALFSLLSFLFFIEHLQKKKIIYLFLEWIAFTIALFCKETAALLPFLFIMYYFTYSFEKHIEKKYLLNIALYAVSGIFWFWLRSMAMGNLTNQKDVGLKILASNLRTVPECLARFFLPFGSGLIFSFSHFYTFAGIGVMILIAVIFFISKEGTKREKAFYLSWFLVLLLPTLVIKIEFIDYLSHRLFLPLIGILLFALFSIPRKWLEEKDMKRKVMVNGGLLCVLVSLSSFTFIKSRPYSDPITFYNSSISENPDNVLMYINRGYAKDSRNDLQGAIEDFTKAIELSPNYAVSYNDRGSIYSAEGDFKKAIKDFDEAIELDSNYVDAYNNRGKAYNGTGNYNQAMIDIDKAIELNPSFADAYNNRGVVYSSRGNLDSAVKDYGKAIELNPYYAKAFNNMGLAYQTKGDLEGAITDYDRAIELDPNLAEAYYNRGNCYSAEGVFGSAIEDYQKAIELNPDYAEAYNNMGLVYQDGGDLENALKDFEKSIELKPAMAEPYYNRGNYYLAKGNFVSALKDYDKAIELRPGYVEAFANRGIAYSAKGDINAAIKDYTKAIELDPGYANAYGNLGNAYKAKGMLKEADQNSKMYEKLRNKYAVHGE
jgi:tetratricopeptide (TPR) repeat protein